MNLEGVVLGHEYDLNMVGGISVEAISIKATRLPQTALLTDKPDWHPDKKVDYFPAKIMFVIRCQVVASKLYKELPGTMLELALEDFHTLIQT